MRDKWRNRVSQKLEVAMNLGQDPMRESTILDSERVSTEAGASASLYLEDSAPGRRWARFMQAFSRFRPATTAG